MNALARAIAAAAAGDVPVAEPDAAARRYLFPPGFPGFSGHFPGHPVLPAIVQLMTVVSFAADVSGAPLRLAGVSTAKFLAPIGPGEEVVVRYARRSAGGKLLYDATLSASGRPAATFVLHLVEDGENR